MTLKQSQGHWMVYERMKRSFVEQFRWPQIYLCTTKKYAGLPEKASQSARKRVVYVWLKRQGNWTVRVSLIDLDGAGLWRLIRPTYWYDRFHLLTVTPEQTHHAHSVILWMPMAMMTKVPFVVGSFGAYFVQGWLHVPLIRRENPITNLSLAVCLLIIIIMCTFILLSLLCFLGSDLVSFGTVHCDFRRGMLCCWFSCS